MKGDGNMKEKLKNIKKEKLFGILVLLFALTAPLFITKPYNRHQLVRSAIAGGLAPSPNPRPG